MRINAISDIHGNLIDAKNFIGGDVLCIAGDISPLKAQRNMPQMIAWIRKRFITWAEELPFDKIFLVAGNHDFVFQNPEFRKEAIVSLNILSDKIVYLEDESFKYKDKLFYGSPWVVGPAGWAFYDGSLSKMKETMPKNADVAIFHQPLEANNNGRVLQIPSWMIGSTMPSHMLTDDMLHPSYGSTILDKLVEERKPKLVITGHVHSGDHTMSAFCDSKVVNVSQLDEDYELRYKPFALDL